MYRDTILKQKNEKERLLSLPYIERSKDSEAKRWLKSNLIKVVIGPRRAGKSVFSMMLLKNEPFMYFNFDDETILESAKFDNDELIKDLHSVYGEIKTILFDEIQNLTRWELFVNRLQREDYNLILTGSNANLLSKELATVLTGRHIPIEILPFNFGEYLKAKGYTTDLELLHLPQEKAKLLKLMESYLLSGGYPEVVTKNIDGKEYLEVLFDSILFKDVVKRYNIRFPGEMGNLGSYLVNNVANCFSLRKLGRALGFRSGITLERYTNYLKEAYIIFSLQRYSTKTTERLKSPKKIYLVDNGFAQAKAVQTSPDKGRLMENLVFMELVKRGLRTNLDLFYYKTRNNREIDFVLKRGTIVYELVQSSFQSANSDTEAREIKGLLEAAEELGVKRLTILTWDERREVKKDGQTVNFIPLWEWLIGK